MTHEHDPHSRPSTSDRLVRSVTNPEAPLTPEEKRSIWTLAIVAGVPMLVLMLIAIDRHYRAVGYEALIPVVAAAAAVLSAAFTGVYVLLTYRLWLSAAAQVRTSQRISEAGIMQSLMAEYDNMRDSVQDLEQFYRQRGLFVEGDFRAQIVSRSEPAAPLTIKADHARYRLSRFFVRLRKLATAHYIDRSLLRAALGRDHIELFLNRVAPLDAIIRENQKKGSNDPDERFYQDLLDTYPRRKFPPRYPRVVASQERHR